MTTRRMSSSRTNTNGCRRVRRRRTPLGIAVRVVVVLAAIGLTYYVVTLYQVWSTGRRDEARPVDAIVVLGAAQYDGRPSPQLAARLDHVVELWQRGLAPIVVVTGGKQPGDRFTEAEASARYLVDHGVPERAIVFENAGPIDVRVARGRRRRAPRRAGCERSCSSPTRSTRCGAG